MSVKKKSKMSRQDDENLSFSLKFETIPIDIDGKEYELRELSEEGHDAYLNHVTAGADFDGEGKIKKFKSMSGMKTGVLCHSLFDLDAKKFVSATELNKWPSKVIDALYERCVELSGLGEDAEEDAEKE